MSYVLPRLVSRFRAISMSDVIKCNLNINTAKNRILFTFTGNKKVDCSWQGEEPVGAQVSDTPNSTIPVSRDAMWNNIVSTETYSLLVNTSVDAIFNDFMEHLRDAK